MGWLAVPAIALGAVFAQGFLGQEEIARTVAFLASPAASFITWANIDVDGGMAAQVGSRASV